MLITCDESTEFSIKVVGAISIPFDNFLDFENWVNKERLENKVFGEIKWDKIRLKGKYFDFYLSMIEKVFSYSKVRFHCNSYKGHKYKARYALVRSIDWKLSNAHYTTELGLLFDSDGNIGQVETELSKDILDRDNKIHHTFTFCQQIDSKMFNILQATDLLAGCVAYKINQDELKSKNNFNPIKEEFIKLVEEHVDTGNDCCATTVGLWNYNSSKKIQHYSLV